MGVWLRKIARARPLPVAGACIAAELASAPCETVGRAL
ncbi:hypothetical protein Asbog_00867 [Asaia bogorensis NBRC 16594]|nr:hypothetical protein Asbog_00867 [Asaia bogorensis NBRC 16594]